MPVWLKTLRITAFLGVYLLLKMCLYMLIANHTETEGFWIRCLKMLDVTQP